MSPTTENLNFPPQSPVKIDLYIDLILAYMVEGCDLLLDTKHSWPRYNACLKRRCFHINILVRCLKVSKQWHCIASRYLWGKLAGMNELIWLISNKASNNSQPVSIVSYHPI